MQVLLDRFINCKMNEEEKMADYVARVTGLAQRLKDMDLEQKTPVVISKILGSLPARYDNIRTAWYTVPRANQTIERLTDHLVNEEALLNLRSRSNDQASEALTTSAKKYSAKKSAMTSDKHTQGKYKSVRRPGKCNFCHIPGQIPNWARECEKKRALQGTKNNESLVAKLKSSGTIQAADNANLLMVNSSINNDSEGEDTWYADSGATEHMSFALVQEFRIIF